MTGFGMFPVTDFSRQGISIFSQEIISEICLASDFRHQLITSWPLLNSPSALEESWQRESLPW